MHELDVIDVPRYVAACGMAASPEGVRATFLTGGVSNVVFRVETPTSWFILKQSRPQLRTRDAWFSDVRRIWREQEIMEALAPYFSEQSVPRVLFVDRENFAFAMSHAPRNAVVWKEQLLAGHVDPNLGEKVGQMLGRMHQISVDHADRFASFEDRTIYDQLRIDPFYRRVQERCPDVATVIAPVIEEMLHRKEALCHGDYTPKNMLVHEGGFTLVDYETAHLGDPTMDLGLCLAHLILKAIRRPADAPALKETIRRFWKAYVDEASFCPLDELERRGTTHLGILLLARIDGTSPVDYLPEEPKREAVRRLARSILLHGLKTWDGVLNELGVTS